VNELAELRAKVVHLTYLLEQATAHQHDFEIHYTAVDWQTPLFVKCEPCGMTYQLQGPE